MQEHCQILFHHVTLTLIYKIQQIGTSHTGTNTKKKEGNLSCITTVTFDFGNAEWCDVGHIFYTRSFATAAVIVAHFIAPHVVFRAVASGFISNNQAL